MVRPLSPRELIHRRYVPVGSLRVNVAFALLPLGELDLVVLDLLVGDQAEKMRDTVEPSAPLLIGIEDVPRRKLRVGGKQHVVTGARIVVPAAGRFDIHGTELPGFARIVDT